MATREMQPQDAPLRTRRARQQTGKYWSQQVTDSSNALDLEPGVFTWSDPRAIAASLKSSAERSDRRRGTPYQAAMSMLNFYVNRAGRNLDSKRLHILEQAKLELRHLFGRRRRPS